MTLTWFGRLDFAFTPETEKRFVYLHRDMSSKCTICVWREGKLCDIREISRYIATQDGIAGPECTYCTPSIHASLPNYEL